MGQVTFKHQTSSVFVFRRLPGGWRIGLIRHPRFHRMMIPGGHVEQEESCAEAALREVAEETGLEVSLVGPPAAPVPPGYLARWVAPPWWIAEYQVPPDNHLGVPHIHVDHLYVALADSTPAGTGQAAGDAAARQADATGQAGAAGHPFGWYAAADLAGLNMFDDARVLALSLLAGLASGTGTSDPAAALLAGLRAAGQGMPWPLEPGPVSAAAPAEVPAGLLFAQQSPGERAFMFEADNIRDWRDHDVVDPDGNKIGQLEAIYVDTATDLPAFASVRTGMIGRHRLTFVPLDRATVSPSHVRVAYSKKQVKDALSIDTDGELAAADEPVLFEHYGLAYQAGAGGERRLARR